MSSTDTPFEWWSSLRHHGLLISRDKLSEFIDEQTPSLPEWKQTRLRDRITTVSTGDTDAVTPLLETVFEDLLGYSEGEWLKGPRVGGEWQEMLMNDVSVRPDWLWQGGHSSLLPVFIARNSNSLGITTDDWVNKQLGVGRSKRAVSRVLEWMRRSNTDLAVITNGRQFRLLYAGLDFHAWCEWDIDLWFQSGQPGPQLEALLRLLHRDAIARPDSEQKPPLIDAILATREGQAELSDVLGERVRRAVELLVRNVDRDKLNALYENDEVSNQHVYIAACRIIMRMVVVLFAEARDLLPRDNSIYNESYGLESLHNQLEKRAGGWAKRLQHSEGAWPRVLALFDLVYSGVAHDALFSPSYGGELFRPGRSVEGENSSPIGHALAVLESPESEISDAVVFRILRLLTRTKSKVQLGRSRTSVTVPVNFSDLSTEYLGIIYEGLLDYELKRADEPMVFLNVGDEPILPFERVDGMSNAQLADLFGELAEKKSDFLNTDVDQVTASLESAPQADRSDNLEPWKTTGDIAEEAAEQEGDDAAREYYEAIFEWAKRAILAAGVLEPPTDATEPEEWTYEFKEKLRDAARELVPSDRIFMPGRWYLVRWGGTRKGSGTFYTRPQLVVPTVRRTLAPLCYDVTDDPDRNEPKKPEELLNLKICDPAMGSGSFLIGALRYVTDALYESLHHHRDECFQIDGERTIIRLADGRVLTEAAEEPIPVPPDHEEFEPRLRARLKRYVVERCIYGVDIDPLAVELARMALWVETMDPHLPFGFLDHKLKCGNSLVGGWSSRVCNYPSEAWQRDGGDSNFSNYVHHYREYTWRGESKTKGDKWDRALKDVFQVRIKPKLDELHAKQRGGLLPFLDQRYNLDEVQNELSAVYRELEGTDVHRPASKQRKYHRDFVESPRRKKLQKLYNLWCSIWFWPHSDLSNCPDPEDYFSQEISKTTLRKVRQISAQHNFFHWELEFPDIFHHDDDRLQGFDAILANPPWDTIQAESLEFFSQVDPLFRATPYHERSKLMKAIFSDSPSVEEKWIRERSHKKMYSHFVASGLPRVEGKEPALLRGHYHLQGKGKNHTYRAFYELVLGLCTPEARLGIITPGALYSDAGSAALRRTILENDWWEFLLMLQNQREWLFNIHSSYKVFVSISDLGKSKQGFDLIANFSSTDIQHILEQPTTHWSYEVIQKLTSDDLRLLEIRDEAEAVLAKSVATRADRSASYLDSFSREFNKSTKGKHLTEGPVPVFDGKDINQFNNLYKCPELYATVEALQKHRPDDNVRAWVWKFAFREVARGDDLRSGIGTVLPPGTSHTYNLCSFELPSFEHALVLCCIYNSFPFNWYLRRVVDKHTSTVYRDLPWPSRDDLENWTSIFLPEAEMLLPNPLESGLSSPGIRSPTERLRVRSFVEAKVAEIFALSPSDYETILSDFESALSKQEKQFAYLLDVLAMRPSTLEEIPVPPDFDEEIHVSVRAGDAQCNSDFDPAWVRGLAKKNLTSRELVGQDSLGPLFD